MYRDPAEPKEWERRDPLDRLRKYMQARGELPGRLRGDASAARSSPRCATRSRTPKRVAPKPPLASLFEDVYAEVPWHLREQRELLEAEIAKHGPKQTEHGG